tara:strand:+ start:2367 stop:2621 length:255 start_codon:yes stop_codon:yes gene_type:complete
MNFESNNSDNLHKILDHLLEECCGNLSVEDLEAVRDRYEIVCRNGVFWVKQDNKNRLAYDLRDFGMWLCDFIANKEREYWDETD